MGILARGGSSGDWRFLGAALKHMRGQAAATQAQVAAELNMDRKTITNYEGGRVPASAPRVPDGYYAVAVFFGLRRSDVDTLLKGPEVAARKYIEEGFYELKNEISVNERHLLANWVVEQASPMLQGRYAQARVLHEASQSSGAPTSEDPATNPLLRTARTLDDAMDALPEAFHFGRLCVELGASEADRLQFDRAALELLRQANEAVIKKAQMRIEEVLGSQTLDSLDSASHGREADG